MCFVGKINLMEIFVSTPNKAEADQKLLDAVMEDRHCESWYPYMPGFSPMEHYEELVMQRLEADRRAYEQRTEESRRRYEERMAKDVEKDRRLFEEANQSRNRALIVASIIVATIIGMAQIIAAFIMNRESLADQLLRRLSGH
jgi:hypothetical protein